jgi:uroporphyrinogen decarboxylase
LPYLTRIAFEVKQKLKDQCLSVVPMVVFAKGAHYALEDLSRSGYDVVGLDWSIDPTFAKIKTQGLVTIQGNADPGILYGTDDLIRQEVRKMAKEFGNGKWIANLGHGMQPDHTPEKLKVFLEAIVC